MKRSRIVWTLAVVNVLLLVALLTETRINAQARRPGEYIMIPSTVPGQTNGVVYLLDTSNGTLVATMFDENRKNISALPPVDLQRVFERGGGGGVVAPPNKRGGGGVVPAPK